MNATLGGHVMDLTGVNISLNNSGTLDPALLGLVSVLSGGAFIGTGATSTVSVLNNASGIIRGTGMLLGLNLTSIDGLALSVNNAATGTTSITNNGTITSTGLSIGGITLADTPVVGVYGGSQVNMTNSSTGVINGRIAFETSAAGNTFTNAGAITGGVSMGAASTNTFTAVTGSSVNVGDGVQISVGLGGLIGINLTFAPTGTVDGGAGGGPLFVAPAGEHGEVAAGGVVHGAVDGDDDVGALPFGDRLHERRGRTPVDLQAIGRCGLEGRLQPAIDGHLEGETAHDGDRRRRCHWTSLPTRRTPPL